MFINNYFSTPVWSEQKPEFVKSLIKQVTNILKKQETETKSILKNTVTLEDLITQHHLQWTMIF